MLWEPLIRFGRGWVTWEAEGARPELILNRAAAAGLPLWRTRGRPCHLRSHCFAADYTRLRPLLRHQGLRLRVRRRHGLPFLLRRVRGRWGLAAGFIVGLLLLWWLPGRIWLISVEGNQMVPATRIEAAAAHYGVTVGAVFEDLDLPAIRLFTLSELPDVAWLTVNPEGCIAHIEVTERPAVPDPDADNTPSNLVAATDGVIQELILEGGFPAVRKGEAVTAGDLLVSGIYETEGFFDMSRSKGRVLAQTEHTLCAAVKLQETLSLPTGRTFDRTVFQFLCWEVPLYTNGSLPADTVLNVADHRPRVRGLTLPVGLIGRTYTACVPTTVTRTEAQAAKLADDKLASQMREQYPTATVLSRQDKDRIENGVFIRESHFVCEEDIAREIPLVITPHTPSS